MSIFFNRVQAKTIEIGQQSVKFVVLYLLLTAEAMSCDSIQLIIYCAEINCNLLFSTVMTSSDPAAASNESLHSPTSPDPLIQYIVIRSDLSKQKGWSTGALIGNGCHACTAVLSTHFQTDEVQSYVSATNLQFMRKVVLTAKDENELVSTSELLKQNNIKNHLWIEMPGKIPVCLATLPTKRSIIQPILKHLKLFR